MTSYELIKYSDLSSIAEKIHNRQTVIKEEINNIVNSNLHHKENFKNILQSKINLDEIASQVRFLKTKTLNSSENFQKISSRVNRLDSTQLKVNDTISQIEKIMFIKTASLKLNQCMSTQNYDTSCDLIYELDKIEDKNFHLAEKLYKNEDFYPEIQMIPTHKKNLKVFLVEKFHNEIQARNDEICKKVCSYLVKIGEREIPMEYFAKYLCELIGDKIKPDPTVQFKDSKYYVQQIIKCIESHAFIIKSYKKFLEETFGSDYYANLISEILNHFSITFGKELKSYYSSGNFTELVEYCSARKEVMYENLSQKEVDEKSASVESVIFEMGVILSRYNLFAQFIKAYNQTIQIKVNIERDYLVFLRFNFSEMMDKAEKRDEFDPSENRIIAIDDSLFIFKKILNYSISTNCINLISKSIALGENVISNRIIKKYRSKILKGINGNWLTQLTSRTSQSTLNGGLKMITHNKKVVYLAILNSLVTFKVDIEKTINELKADFLKTSFNKNSNDWNELYLHLDSMKIKIIQDLDGIIESGFKSINETIIKAKLINLDSFKKASYVLNQESLDDFFINDPWVKAYITFINVQVKNLQNSLEKENFIRFLDNFVYELTIELEKQISIKVFNFHGGIQLDKEIRLLNQFFTHIGNWSVREKFTRINQILILLTLESLDEGPGYWKENTWKLAPNEIKRFLILREDFKQSDIQKMQIDLN